MNEIIDMESRVRYSFSVQKSRRTYRLKQSLALFAVAFLPLGGLLLLVAGLKISGITINEDSLYPIVVLQLLFVAVILFLRVIKYNGSYVPLAAIMVLMGIGSVMQTRMAVDTDPFSEINMESIQDLPSEPDSKEEEGLLKKPLTGLGAQHVAFSLSIILLPAVIFFFSRSGFDWVGRKYMTVFTGTVLFFGLLVILSIVVQGGKFLFSRIPWELIKITLPLAIAGFLADNSRFLSVFRNGRVSIPIMSWGPFVVFCSIPFALFAVLGDFGQVMIFGAVFLIMLFISTKSLVYPLIGALGLLLAPALLTLISDYLPNHIAQRLDLWQNFWNGFPSSLWWDRSYQTANAFFAMNAGGLAGTGLGFGNPQFVPLSHSDFIFAGIAEELGFVGTSAIFLLYLSVIVTGFHTASLCTKRFDFLAVTALTVTFCCQIFINIGGVINIIPLTGIVLPFLSKGGFSLITFTVLVGMIMAASHKYGKNISSDVYGTEIWATN